MDWEIIHREIQFQMIFSGTDIEQNMRTQNQSGGEEEECEEMRIAEDQRSLLVSLYRSLPWLQLSRLFGLLAEQSRPRPLVLLAILGTTTTWLELTSISKFEYQCPGPLSALPSCESHSVYSLVFRCDVSEAEPAQLQGYQSLAAFFRKYPQMTSTW